MIRFGTVFNALGKILLIVDVGLMFPLLWAIITGGDDVVPFLLTATIYGAVGGALVFFVKSQGNIRAKEGYLIVSLTWILVSLIGALPYFFAGAFPDYSSAFFETISGFTTTGSTAFADIEAVSQELLLWRALTQWLGGLGVVVLFVAVLSQVDTGGVTMLRAELSGPFNEKISSHIQDTAIILWLMYVFLTGLLTVLLMFGGMSFFDAICHAFTTMATGGYSTHNASVAYFNSAYIECVITIFMFFGGMSYPFMYKAFVKRNFSLIRRNEEFRCYIFVVVAATLLVFIDLMVERGGSVFSNFRGAAFQVVSQLTTTGFVTENFDLWPTAAHVTIICLMMIGACYSSTSGSVKVGSYVVFYKAMKTQFFRMLHPRAMVQTKVNGKPIDEKIVMRVLLFMLLFYLLAFWGSILVAATGIPFDESITASMSAVSNSGPALGSMGAVGNYAAVPAFGKWVLGFLMLAGRLELFTIFIIFVPTFWRR
ncbi:MAG: TrkH family potassium uptake protein [Bacillota bacterium]|nr:TrkH family potassium uptake protein [Bacillota bacterium]